MATYKELQEQIQALQQQAREARGSEVENVIQQIKTIMADYAITLDDLGFRTRGKSTKVNKTKAKAQFKDNAGNTWSGRGRMPGWLKGKNKEDFRARAN